MLNSQLKKSLIIYENVGGYKQKSEDDFWP